MTREEAIYWIENLSGSWDGQYREARDMAIAALREQKEYEGLKNSYAQLQASFDQIYESNMAMGVVIKALRERTDWVSVEESMPGDWVSVLGYMTDAGECAPVRECYAVDGNFWFPALREFHPVSHWMPMPTKEKV